MGTRGYRRGIRNEIRCPRGTNQVARNRSKTVRVKSSQKSYRVNIYDITRKGQRRLLRTCLPRGSLWPTTAATTQNTHTYTHTHKHTSARETRRRSYRCAGNKDIENHKRKNTRTVHKTNDKMFFLCKLPMITSGITIILSTSRVFSAGSPTLKY